MHKKLSRSFWAVFSHSKKKYKIVQLMSLQKIIILLWRPDRYTEKITAAYTAATQKEILSKMDYANLRTVRQLMTVAEKDSIKEFTELLDENFLTLFVNACVTADQPALKEISVIITGLMARNARQCIEVFLKYLNNKNIPLDDSSLDAPIKLAGILIREKKCSETVNYFIKNCVNTFGSRAVEYIAGMAVYTDDLSLFKILYNSWGDKKIRLYNFLEEEAFSSLCEIAFLGGVVFNSRNILDYITDCGRLLKRDNLPFYASSPFSKIYLLEFIKQEFYLQYPGYDSHVVCWLTKLWEIFFKDTPPDKAYDCLKNIAVNTGMDVSFCIVFNKSFTYHNISMTTQMLMAEIAGICGTRIQDISFITLLFENSSNTFKDHIYELVQKTAGDKPYVKFNELGFQDNAEKLLMYADIFGGDLTVRLTKKFTGEELKKLCGKVKFELDFSDPSVLEYLRGYLNDTLPDHKRSKKDLYEMLKILIGKQLASPEELAGLVDARSDPNVLKYIFELSQKKEENT